MVLGIGNLTIKSPVVNVGKPEEQQHAAHMRTEMIARAGDDFCTLLYVLRCYQGR